jgi:hypothetical protein
MMMRLGMGETESTMAPAIALASGETCYPAGVTFIQAPRLADGSLMPPCSSQKGPDYWREKDGALLSLFTLPGVALHKAGLYESDSVGVTLLLVSVACWAGLYLFLKGK